MITAAAKTVTFFNSVVGVCNESQLHQEIGMVIKFQVGGEKTLLRHLVRSGGRRIMSGGFRPSVVDEGEDFWNEI